MSELPPAKLAFRVTAVAGGMAIAGALGPGLHWFAGVTLLVLAAVLVGLAVAGRKDPMALRRQRLLSAAIAGVAAAVLLSGIAEMLMMPLFVLAAVAGALGVVAVLGETGEPEDRHPE